MVGTQTAQFPRQPWALPSELWTGSRVISALAEDATELRAQAQNGLGNAYRNLAQIEDREGNLRRAIAAYTEALQYHTPTVAPLDYAMTQNNLGNAYGDLAAIEDREVNLRSAIEAYTAALQYRTPDVAPLDYAMTQNNFGAAYSDLAAIEDQEDNLRRAIAAYTEALKYYTPAAARSTMP